jgi:hypothetical protein
LAAMTPAPEEKEAVMRFLMRLISALRGRA